jgi:ParB family chromosome partitioning protein
MPSDFQLAVVSLSAIDSENGTFRITTNREVADLVSAFERVGLTNPPVLLTKDDGYLVVCGFRRIAAARDIGWTTIPARILPPDTDPVSCALFTISENSIERSLNLVETSRALSLIESLTGDKKKMVETARKAGLPGNPSLFTKMLPICRLPEPLQEGLLSGNLALPSVYLLSKLPPDTAVALTGFLTKLKLSLHKQRELIDILFEISKLEDISIESVLASREIDAIFNDEKTDLPQKSGRIREYLKQRRYPNLTKAQAEFEILKSDLKLGENVTLKAPPGFESNRFNLSFTFANPDDLENHLKTLEKLTQHNAFKTFLSSRDPRGH